MKKKILFTLLLVSMLVCVFAISVGAVTYTYVDAENNELYSYDYDTSSFLISNNAGEGFSKTDADGNALTWYITATETDADGNITHTVASLKTLGEAGSINGNGAYSFTSPVTNKNTVSVNFPDDSGIKTWAFKTFGGYNTRVQNNILFVYCPNTLTAFENNPFQETKVIVVELDDETPITSIPQNFCHEARNLTSINIPASVTVINGHSGQNGAAFYNCSSLKTVTFAKGSELVKINNSVFLNCASIEEIILPNKVTTLGERAFQHCTSLKKISFGASLENLTQSLTYQSDAIQYNYLPNTITASSGTHVFPSEGSTKGVIFFSGTLEELEALKSLIGTNNQGRINHTNYLEWDSTISDDEYVEKAVADKKHYIVYNYNTCKAFYNNIHETQPVEGNTCQGTCANCGKTELLANPVHTSVWCFADEDGNAMSISKKIVATHVCQACATVEKVENIDIIIEPLGYTQAEDGSDLAYKASVNQTALAKYEELSGETVKYGLLAGIAMESSDGTPISIDEETGALVADNATVLVNMTGTNYSVLQIKITGINANTALYCNAYAVIGTDVSYICETASSTATKKDITIVE